jgi:hypothetical protein
MSDSREACSRYRAGPADQGRARPSLPRTRRGTFARASGGSSGVSEAARTQTT